MIERYDKSMFSDILRLLADAFEYAEIPVRHNGEYGSSNAL